MKDIRVAPIRKTDDGRSDMPAEGVSRIRRAALLVGALALSLGLSGCDIGIFDPHGPIGSAEMVILLDALGVMLAIVVPTIIATLVFAWWFRASNDKAIHLPDWEFSGRIEIVVWSIPVLVILFLGGITWISSHDLDPYKTPDQSTRPLEIQVVSLDWKWLFIYPEQGIASVNELAVPTHTPLHFTLTSASVMSAFFVPQLGSMIYTMNGMTTQLNLEANRTGDLDGLSAHYNGDGFSDMHFVTKAMQQDDFIAWVAKARQANRPLDSASYRDLSKQSANLPVSMYSSVEAGLFDKVVAQDLPPGPGPTPSVSPKLGE